MLAQAATLVPLMPVLLAQVDAVKPLADGLGSPNFLGYALAIVLLVTGYLFRELRLEQEKRIAAEREANKEIQGILREVIPLTTKLTDAVELLDRAVDKITEG